MSYVVESGASRARRARRRRALITLGVVALMLFFAFWYAYSYYRDSDKAKAAPTTTCTTSAAKPTGKAAARTPAQVTVNVYNATERNGLAAKTATDIRKRGYKVATVSNDPLQRTVTIPAEVRYGTSGTASAKLVLTLVKGSKAVRDSRTDASVDLVLGDKFTALTPAPKTVPATTPRC
jgi:LytR cell envelope-related transcriptional attenuator